MRLFSPKRWNRVDGGPAKSGRFGERLRLGGMLGHLDRVVVAVPASSICANLSTGIGLANK